MNFSDIIKEIIEPDSVDVTSIKMNKELNPLLWDGDHLKEDVRKILLSNAKKFIEFSNLENIKFKDIVLLGSMANYNYTEHSDIDVHLIFNFNEISDNKEFVKDYLKTKKLLWDSTFNIQVKGFDVELYYQDIDEKNHSTGVYSLIKDKWLSKPLKKIINIDTKNVQAKASKYMNAIDDLEKIKNDKKFYDEYLKLKDKIKKMRENGLDKKGEYSSENLAYKILRNEGYLDKMVELKNDYISKNLSLNEKEKSNIN